MAAFIRAAYGKGYCDALTEEALGARSAWSTATASPSASPSATPRSRAAFRRPALHFPRGPEVESRPARDRAVRGRGAGGLPALHVHRGRRESLDLSERARRRTEQVQLAGLVTGPCAAMRTPAGLRFRLRDIDGDSRASVRVLYAGSVPDLFKVGRHIVVDGRLRTASSWPIRAR